MSKAGVRVVEEGTGVGDGDVHIGRARLERNFDNDEAEEGEEDSDSGVADLGSGTEEDMGDLRAFSNSRSSRDLEGSGFDPLLPRLNHRHQRTHRRWPL